MSYNYHLVGYWYIPPMNPDNLVPPPATKPEEVVCKSCKGTKKLVLLTSVEECKECKLT